MKAYGVCACLVVLLLVSPTAFGIIVETGYWDGDDYGGGTATGWWDYTSARGRARGYQPTSWAGGEGSQEQRTTQAGDFDFFYTAYVYTDAQFTLYNNDYCAATTYASATASGPRGSLSFTASLQVSHSGTGGLGLFEQDGSYTDYRNGTEYFSAYDGVGGTNYAVAGASVPSGSSSRVDAYAFAEGWGSLSGSN